MIKNIRHTGIVVEDLNRSLSFYRDLLEFQISKQMDESGNFINSILKLEDVKVTTIKMEAPDGQLIELLKFHSHQKKGNPKGICDIGITHIAFTVEDIEQVHKRLVQSGITFLSTPQSSPDEYAKVAFCRAPEGTFIELVEELGN